MTPELVPFLLEHGAARAYSCFLIWVNVMNKNTNTLTIYLPNAAPLIVDVTEVVWHSAQRITYSRKDDGKEITLSSGLPIILKNSFSQNPMVEDESGVLQEVLIYLPDGRVLDYQTYLVRTHSEHRISFQDFETGAYLTVASSLPIMTFERKASS